MKKTLVIGASLKPHRYSNIAIKKLTDAGEEVVALGLRKGVVHGVNIDTERIAYTNIHTVSLYLNPKRQPDYYKYITSLKPVRVIFNPGTENAEFSKILVEHGIIAEISCTLVLLATDQY